MARVLINIDVDDLAKAVAFYSQAFGLRVGRRFGEGGVEMLGAETPVYLLVKAKDSAASSTGVGRRDYGRHWTPVHLDLVVDDIETAVKRAEDAGAVLEAPVKSSNWGKLALMADPFGHGFCLIEFVGRGYDEIADTL
jgi:predicted enzyme related to lactoylglutathione lyase